MQKGTMWPELSAAQGGGPLLTEEGAYMHSLQHPIADARTASAAEVLAGALQENGRATLVGPAAPGHTFGKARIQNVQPLADGSGVAVTRQRYLTPRGRDMNGRGLALDVARETGCAPADDALACLGDAWRGAAAARSPAR